MKVKSLAAEAAMIRLEELRAMDRKDTDLYVSLSAHRKNEVRREQRSALLAYAFVRGRDYGPCERPAKANRPDLVRVKQLVEKYGCRPGYLKYKLADGVLDAWVAGTLTDHPFRKGEGVS